MLESLKLSQNSRTFLWKNEIPYGCSHHSALNFFIHTIALIHHPPTPAPGGEGGDFLLDYIILSNYHSKEYVALILVKSLKWS